MAVWEPQIENYLGFPEGLSGQSLLELGREQVRRFGTVSINDEIRELRRHEAGGFAVGGQQDTYHAQRVLLATGLTHLLPAIPGAEACLGMSLFFCKDCDALRVQGRTIVVMGRHNDAARYALAMLTFSPSVSIATNGEAPMWDASWQQWLEEYGVRVRREPILAIEEAHGQVQALRFASGGLLAADALFALRGDVFHTGLAEGLGAAEDEEGQLIVDADMRTTVPGLYAAGCVTPANCQMMIAAGQGATAAQAINRDLFEDNLRRHTLPMFVRRVGERMSVSV